jgi:hypothetical protein
MASIIVSDLHLTDSEYAPNHLGNDENMLIEVAIDRALNARGGIQSAKLPGPTIGLIYQVPQTV